MNKLEEIFKAWSIAFNPDDAQADLAAKRIEICEDCEFKSYNGMFTYCSVCGCALKAKIYTPVIYSDQGGSCPKEKWMDVEKEWVDKKNQQSE